MAIYLCSMFRVGLSIRPFKIFVRYSMHILLIALVLCCCLRSDGFSQTVTKSNELWHGDTVYSSTTITPQPKADFNKWLQTAIRYPKKARKAKIIGRSVVEFIVDKQGHVQSPRLTVSSGNQDLDAEAVRVVSTMPDWWPGLVNGDAVPTLCKFPLTFRLE